MGGPHLRSWAFNTVTLGDADRPLRDFQYSVYGRYFYIFFKILEEQKNKLDFIVDNSLDYDILCFTETKLNSIISDDRLQ